MPRAKGRRSDSCSIQVGDPRRLLRRHRAVAALLALGRCVRVWQIAGLQLDDVLVDVARPHLRLRRETTKGKKPRMAPLCWNAGTLAELVEREAKVSAAAGCSNVAVTSVYLHVFVDDEEVGYMFQFGK
jgi:hypothetical protein